MTTYWVSRRGYKALVERRSHLLEEIRETQKQLGDAVRRDNDLRENPEYLELSMRLDTVLRKQLSEATATIAASRIFEDVPAFGTDPLERVSLGTRVTIEDECAKQQTYAVVGFGEPDGQAGDISYLSPLARALMGKQVGEEVTVNLPGGQRRLRIASIERDTRFVA